MSIKRSVSTDGGRPVVRSPDGFGGEQSDDEAKPRSPRATGVGYQQIILTFLLGFAAGYALMAFSSDDPHSARSLVFGAPSPSSPARSTDVDPTLQLLTSLDLAQYSSIVKKRGLTVPEIAKYPPDTIEEGFKAYHWKRIVMEAKKMTEGGDEASDHVSSETAVKTMAPIKAESEDDLNTKAPSPPASEPVPPPSGELVPPPSGEPVPPPSGEPVVPSKPLVSQKAPDVKEPGVKAPSPRTLPPRPTYAPPPAVPAFCESRLRSQELKALWWKVKNQAQPPVKGLSTEVPAACANAAIEAKPVPVEPLLTLQHPTLEASKTKSFLKQSLSLQHMRELRLRGTSEQFYVDHKLKLLYCVVPKAGCTTYKAWMLHYAGKFKGGTVHNRNLYKGPRVINGQFMKDEDLMAILNDGEYFKFTITRSPYTRALATYLERFNNCEMQTRRTKQECDMWKRALVGERSQKQFVPRDNMTFTDYLNTIKSSDMSIIDFRNAHWLSNVRVCALDRVKYDWVGRLEDPTDSEVLFNITGQPGNWAGKKDRNLRHSEGTLSKIPKYYDGSSKQLVKEIFAQDDVSLLGYVPDGIVP